MLISLAVDYQVADVATRERFHVPAAEFAALYARLNAQGVTDAAMMATCNRTELYAWCPGTSYDHLNKQVETLARCWMQSEADAAALLAVSIRRVGLVAARHAMRVAGGLESQLLGDGQILGQVRDAYGDASAAEAAGSVVHRLFMTALRAGKRVQAETLLNSGRNSVGAQAASLARRHVERIDNARVVIVGCGKTGERVARQLSKYGIRDLVMINRSPERAIELANELVGRSAPMEAMHAEIARAHVAIVATGSTLPIVLTKQLAAARNAANTNHDELLLIDLSMPRNIDVSATELVGVSLVDIDSLRPQVSATEQTRRSAIPAAEAIVETELQDFAEWMSAANAREAIRPLREALADVCRRELAHAAGEEVAERLSKRIVAKMMARPMSAVRVAMARGEPVSELTRTMSALFSTPAHDANRASMHAGSNAE